MKHVRAKEDNNVLRTGHHSGKDWSWADERTVPLWADHVLIIDDQLMNLILANEYDLCLIYLGVKSILEHEFDIF